MRDPCIRHIWTWRKTFRKFVIRISWKKFVCIPKFCGNFNEISGKFWNIRFWGTFSYILETVWGNRNREFWESLQIFKTSEKIINQMVWVIFSNFEQICNWIVVWNNDLCAERNFPVKLFKDVIHRFFHCSVETRLYYNVLYRPVLALETTWLHVYSC